MYVALVASPSQPKLVIALPDYDKRKIVIASDEVIDGERIVCVAIDGESPVAQSDAAAVKLEQFCIPHIVSGTDKFYRADQVDLLLASGSAQPAMPQPTEGDAIAKCKNILWLVDEYVTIQSASNRTALRMALMDEFDAGKPTDLSKRLREYAATGKAHSPKLLAQAADEIERYYGGMLAWKKSAETKDRDLSKERLARQNERIAARATQAATVTGDDPIGDLQAEARQAKLDDFVHAASTVTAYPPEAVERLLTAVKVYAHNYMQDEAEPEADSDDLVCSQKQHVEAVEVFAAIKAMAPGAKP